MYQTRRILSGQARIHAKEIGESCSKCGIFFSVEHGYRVVCEHCFKRLAEHERPKYRRATYPVINSEYIHYHGA